MTRGRYVQFAFEIFTRRLHRKDYQHPGQNRSPWGDDGGRSERWNGEPVFVMPTSAWNDQLYISDAGELLVARPEADAQFTRRLADEPSRQLQIPFSARSPLRFGRFDGDDDFAVYLSYHGFVLWDFRPQRDVALFRNAPTAVGSGVADGEWPGDLSYGVDLDGDCEAYRSRVVHELRMCTSGCHHGLPELGAVHSDR
jgi:hypothetical protein